jgi:hypothetical protein
MAEKLPTLRTAAYPGDFSVDSETEMSEKIERTIIEQIIEGLTKQVEPKSGESKEGGLVVASDRKKCLSTGSYEEIIEYFYNNHFTDGLAINPPTIEKVEKFLNYTDYSPNEEICLLSPGNRRATP